METLRRLGQLKFTTRPVVMGTNWAVASGHYLSALAGYEVLSRGGNAIDAAAAMGFALGVLEPHLNSIGGEVPMLIHVAKEGRVLAVSGQGFAPKSMTIDWFKSRGIKLIPGDGLLPATVPALVSAWITVLKLYGTKSLTEVLSPSIALSEEGFPMYGGLADTIYSHAELFSSRYPTTAKVFLPNGGVPQEGEVFRQVQLARTLRKLIEAEAASAHRGRDVALDAAHEAFYKGEMAHRVHEFAQKTEVLDATGERNNGFLTKEDLSSYSTIIEEPVSMNYRGYDVFKCGPWTQGPVFLQTLGLLEGFELSKMGHNTVDYIHLLVEAFKLSFADRERYYGDPKFDDVPLGILLSEGYAESRRKLIDMTRASSDLIAGNVLAETKNVPRLTSDTTHLDAVDKDGNMVSATQSGAWITSSPLVEGLGFPLGTRGQMFYLDPKRNNALQPLKRPRTTLTPSMVKREGRPYMAFGTPGGDMQDQWTLQFFLNLVEFRMDLQEALDAPLLHTLHFPSSFYPRASYPRRVVLENRIPSHVVEGLGARGHEVEMVGPWSLGRVSAVSIDGEGRVLSAAVSPRKLTGYSLAW